MKEILYIQAGETANYVGSHFWNTQECYLTDEDESVYDRQISFRDSLAPGSEVRHFSLEVPCPVRFHACPELGLVQSAGPH